MSVPELKLSPELLEEISRRGANLLIELMNQYDLPVKAVGTVWAGVKQKVAEHYSSVTQQYVEERLNEQVNLYITRGIHEHAGYTPNTFRILLEPLIQKTMRHFASLGEHLVMRGEFTILLVLPTRLVSLRRQLMTLMGESTPEVFPDDFETHLHGKKSPEHPYVLVGIDGGRKLKSFTIANANDFVLKNKYTYFAVHELVQLLMVRPEFLESQSESGDLVFGTPQLTILALGEKCPTRGIVKVVAHLNQYLIEFINANTTTIGEGVGKPYYSAMITHEIEDVAENK